MRRRRLFTYQISRDGTQIATVTSASTTTVSFQDTGLTASSTHTYSVVAVDQANNAGPPSPTSDQITVQTGTPPGNRPNILLIVTDDQRMATDTMMVMPKTTALFEDQGTNFPNGYVTTPLCCPSRSTIHSGRYAHNTHVLTNGDLDATLAYDQSATTQRYLHDAGYQTAIVGKFLTNWPVERNPSYFDRWSIFAGQYWAANYNIDGTMRQINGYTTDVLANQADGIAPVLREPGFEAVVPLSGPARAPLELHAEHAVPEYRRPTVDPRAGVPGVGRERQAAGGQVADVLAGRGASSPRLPTPNPDVR